MKWNNATGKLMMGLMLAVGMNTSANAALIALNMEGVVDGFHSSLSGPGGFSVGTPMTGSMTFDNSVADIEFGTFSGIYPSAITAWSYTIGAGSGARTYTSTGSEYRLQVSDSGFDSLNTYPTAVPDSSISGPSVNGLPPGFLDLTLFGPSSVLSSDSLPDASFDFADFNFSSSWFVAFDIGGGYGIVSGSLSEITASAIAVPEPETYALMLAGLWLIGWQAQRKVQSNSIDCEE